MKDMCLGQEGEWLQGDREGVTENQIAKDPESWTENFRFKYRFQIFWRMSDNQENFLESEDNGVWDACLKVAEAIQVGPDGGEEVKKDATRK